MVILKKQNKQTKQYSKFQICQIPMKFTFPKYAFLVYETHTGEDKSSVPTYYIPRPNAMPFNAIVYCSKRKKNHGSCIVLRAFRKMCLL